VFVNVLMYLFEFVCLCEREKAIEGERGGTGVFACVCVCMGG